MKISVEFEIEDDPMSVAKRLVELLLGREDDNELRQAIMTADVSYAPLNGGAA